MSEGGRGGGWQYQQHTVLGGITQHYYSLQISKKRRRGRKERFSSTNTLRYVPNGAVVLYNEYDTASVATINMWVVPPPLTTDSAQLTYSTT